MIDRCMPRRDHYSIIADLQQEAAAVETLKREPQVRDKRNELNGVNYQHIFDGGVCLACGLSRRKYNNDWMHREISMYPNEHICPGEESTSGL